MNTLLAASCKNTEQMMGVTGENGVYMMTEWVTSQVLSIPVQKPTDRDSKSHFPWTRPVSCNTIMFCID